MKKFYSFIFMDSDGIGITPRMNIYEDFETFKKDLVNLLGSVIYGSVDTFITTAESIEDATRETKRHYIQNGWF